MSTQTTSSSPAPSRALQGIICVELGMLVFVVQDAMMKHLLPLYSIWLLLFIRSVVATLILVPMIAWLGAPHRLFTPLWPLHALRGALFAVGFSLFYAAFPFMGLAEVSTIFFSAPLLTALFAAIWLKETIGRHRIAALVVGFIGVVIAINPSAANFKWVSILPFLCAVAYAAGQVLARHVGDRESSLTLGLHTLFFSGVFIFPMGWLINTFVPVAQDYVHLRMAFPVEALQDLHRLALLGIGGMLGYIFLSRAYQVANASLVAPFDYTYLPIATAMGYFVWGEVPPTATYAGMVLIVGSGLYLGFRELRATKESDDSALVGESVFPPTAVPLTQVHEEENIQQ
ncbi:MAG: DMT family transporter [Pseudomonadota bacterium]